VPNASSHIVNITLKSHFKCLVNVLGHHPLVDHAFNTTLCYLLAIESCKMYFDAPNASSDVVYITLNFLLSVWSTNWVITQPFTTLYTLHYTISESFNHMKCTLLLQMHSVILLTSHYNLILSVRLTNWVITQPFPTHFTLHSTIFWLLKHLKCN
jgi:hypothetical protein